MELHLEMSKDQQSFHCLGWKEASHAACWSPACTPDELQVQGCAEGSFNRDREAGWYLQIKEDTYWDLSPLTSRVLPRRFWVQRHSHVWQNASLVAPQFLEGHECVLYRWFCVLGMCRTPANFEQYCAHTWGRLCLLSIQWMPGLPDNEEDDPG